MRASRRQRTARPPIFGDALTPLDDDEIRSIQAPGLFMTGAHSPAFLLRLTDRLEELLSNVERVEIPDASHLMHEDNPVAVNEAIVGFLGRHRAG